MHFQKLLTILLLTGICTLLPEFTSAQSKNEFINTEKLAPVDLVYPHLDAANSRWFFFSSACRPFGMVNLSPDMAIDGAWNSGYRYVEDSIYFFSHIHAWQMSGIPMLPTTGEFKGHLGPDSYKSAYQHNKEEATPGYHRVFLEDYDILAELTSTTRVGFHRYTFPESDESQILLDLGTVLGPSGTQSGSAKKVSATEIAGHATMEPTGRRPQPLDVYYVIQLDKPFRAMKGWQDKELLGEVAEFEGEGGGIYMEFDTEAEEEILMKVGISYVSIEQARLNLETELPHWVFDEIVEASKEEWNQTLSKIEIEGGSFLEKRRFYTDLWHALQGRRIISDVNGKYCDRTGGKKRIGQIPLDDNDKPAFNHYNSDSFWGAQWTISTLWQLAYPEIAEDFVNSMLLMYDDGGLIPRGPSGGNYTYVMTGASSTPFIVGAYMKGIRGYEVDKAYEGLKKNHMPGGIMARAGYEHNTEKGGGLEYYLDRGYIPYPMDDKRWGGHQDGAGQTLEYAYQDWCLAQMAKSLGREEDYAYFMERSDNWKNLLDPETGWIRPRERDGSWRSPFDPYAHQKGFVESNSAQSTWYVPHDLAGLAEEMGGREIMAQKLEKSFEEAAKQDFTAGKSHDQELQAELRRVPINYGNQPSIQTAFVFNHIGYPWLTQYWSREVIEKAFSDLSPQRGYNGDEDQGLMGALSVLMKMGIFEMKSGNETEPQYELGSPLFDKVTVHLNPDFYPGEKLVIEAKNTSSNNRYIQSATLNGESLNTPFVPHKSLVKGSVLRLEMGDMPQKEWGKGEKTLRGK
ncbi:putative alpha-1,2-mannosidase [Catalinimonas alkaloidigena]|uniref:GH92 family glycosyl hydrolase n=1 Tax=Catalinimonas alkaloidigena TaxID=1075417 RepID=UPI00240571A2|nr:GH92 family glycosyl hydrolase [Catalinimonas alkaloidigena]MDF9796433.1 putative alpha-1,2-mannosidase [Catalinimonas alkaloidigena]